MVLAVLVVLVLLALGTVYVCFKTGVRRLAAERASVLVPAAGLRAWLGW
jgi:hypothetical protein